MPQIVFEKCIHCGQEIQADPEGQFCSICGHPAHHTCVDAALALFHQSRPKNHTAIAEHQGGVHQSQSSASRCPICAAPMGDEEAHKKRLEELDAEADQRTGVLAVRHARAAAVNDILLGGLVTSILVAIIWITVLAEIRIGLFVSILFFYGIRRLARGIVALRDWTRAD